MSTLPYPTPAPAVVPKDGEALAGEQAPDQIASVLLGYRDEAQEARRSGPSPRDEIWDANWNRYWNRYDFSDKADWQSKHVMPEVPQLVDRWAASMREALDTGGDWFTTMDEGKDSALVPLVTKAMIAILGRCSRTPDGHVADFSSVFEDQMKLGAIMACCVAVTWKTDSMGSFVGVDTVDPREYWADPKNRNLYRLRQYQIDKYELLGMAQQADSADQPLYNTEVIQNLVTNIDEKLRIEKETSAGHGQGTGETAGRTIVKIDEWLGSIILPDGTLAYSNSLTIVANDSFIIRGPEQNPFWHGRDWIVYTPMVTVPLSVYGRTYMEDWTAVSDAFIELTNLILDGVFTSAVKAFVANPSMLEDPTQLTDGISPNAIFQTTEDVSDVRKFMSSLDLGTLPQEALTVWSMLKKELQEGAKLSEIALGQMAPHSRTTKAEIQQVTRSGSSLVRSMARTIESRLLEPTLTLVWKTALQNMDFMTIADIIGEDAARMFNARREEFAGHPFSFRVRGISGIVDRQAKLQNVLSALNVIGNNELLAQALLSEMDPQKLVQTLFVLFGIDPAELKPTERESAMKTLMGMIPNGQQPAPAQQSPQGAAPGAVR